MKELGLNMTPVGKGRPAGSMTSIESIALNTLKKGSSFFTTKQDKDVTAIATHYKKKVRTERLYTISPLTGKTMKVVKVTILK